MNLKIVDLVIGAMAGAAAFILWLSATGIDASPFLHLIGLAITGVVMFGVWQWLRKHSAHR